jgi:hypothetical protein
MQIAPAGTVAASATSGRMDLEADAGGGVQHS